MTEATAITIGTRVMFSRKFLQSTGQYTGPYAPTSYGPFARGVVQEVTGDPEVWCLARIAWADGVTTSVNIRNLVREDRIHLEQ